jgi:hypothetical protein
VKEAPRVRRTAADLLELKPVVCIDLRRPGITMACAAPRGLFTTCWPKRAFRSWDPAGRKRPFLQRFAAVLQHQTGGHDNLSTSYLTLLAAPSDPAAVDFAARSCRDLAPRLARVVYHALCRLRGRGEQAGRGASTSTAIG